MKQYYFALKNHHEGHQYVAITAVEFFDREGCLSDMCSSCIDWDSNNEPIFDEDFNKFAEQIEEKFNVYEQTSCWLAGTDDSSTFDFSPFIEFLKKHKNFEEDKYFTEFVESHG